MIQLARPIIGLLMVISNWAHASIQADTCIDPPNPTQVLVQSSESVDCEVVITPTETSEAERNLQEMIQLLKDNEKLSINEVQLSESSLKKQIAEFHSQSDQSPAEIQQFWEQTVGGKNYFRRQIAVRLLVREQNMDNVPGLIYAVSDPDFRIAFEAHQGLRLLSRKVDSMRLSELTFQNACRDPGTLHKSAKIVASVSSEFKTMEAKWSDWFLGIRPEAQLYKPNEPELSEVSP